MLRGIGLVLLQSGLTANVKLHFSLYTAFPTNIPSVCCPFLGKLLRKTTDKYYHRVKETKSKLQNVKYLLYYKYFCNTESYSCLSEEGNTCGPINTWPTILLQNVVKNSNPKYSYPIECIMYFLYWRASDLSFLLDGDTYITHLLLFSGVYSLRPLH